MGMKRRGPLMVIPLKKEIHPACRRTLESVQIRLHYACLFFGKKPRPEKRQNMVGTTIVLRGENDQHECVHD